MAAATGRTDLLEQVRCDAALDLKPVLAAAKIASEAGGPVRWEGERNDRPEAHPPIDDAWVQPALEAFKAGTPYSHRDARVTNEDRTLGARLAGQIALFRTQTTLPRPART